MKTVIKIISTFYYVGYLPLIPGTFGSLAAVGLYYLIKDSPLIYFTVTSAIIVLGFLVCSRAEEVFNKKDSRYIVIDEVAGMLIALSFLPYDIRLVIIGFLIFRLLDTFKPYPACALESLKGGAGVMADDIVAGLYTNIILQIVLRFASFKAS